MSYHHGNWDRPKAKRVEPLRLEPRDWEFEARSAERNAENHFRNLLYFELAALFANYTLRAAWIEGAKLENGYISRLTGRECHFEVFAQCDDKRQFPIAKLAVKLRHNVTNPARSAARWKTHFGRNAMTWSRALRGKLLPSAESVQLAHKRKLVAQAAKEKRAARMVERAPATFDALEKLTD